MKKIIFWMVFVALATVRYGYDVQRVGCGHYRVTPVLMDPHNEP